MGMMHFDHPDHNLCDKWVWFYNLNKILFKIFIVLKAQCVTFTKIYFQKKDRKRSMYVFSYVKSLKK